MKTGFFSIHAPLLTLAVLLTATAPAQTDNSAQYYFTTLVGAASAGTADGTGSQARFHTPGAIAVDGSGNLYVADTLSCTIRKITATGMVTTLAGKAGYTGSADGTGSDARFFYPYGITIDLAGNLFVADTSNSTIRKISPAGVVTTVAGTAPNAGSLDGTGSAALFNNPQGITVDAMGNLYVADTGNNLIRKISATGVVTTLAGSTGEYVSTNGAGSMARFIQPQGIVVDPAGNLYVCELTMIRKITPTGDVTSLAGIPKPMGSADGFGTADGTGTNARFSGPFSITRDGAGNLYVTDTFNHTIRKITLDGVVTTIAGKAGVRGSADGSGDQASFFEPEGITADSVGNIFVADTYNQTIRKINPAGLVSTVAGLAPDQCTGSIDGFAGAARFYGAQGLAAGSTGDLYVADTQNHLIRKITPAGAVTTLAGLAGNAGYADGSGSSARFNLPADVAVDSHGNVYVADTGNNVIRKITAAGSVSTLAGKFGQAGTSDGPSDQALFSHPSGIAVDPSGAVFVADAHRIRKIGTDGQVSTIALDTSNDPLSYESVAVGVTGNLYASVGDRDNENFGIVKITPTGSVWLFSTYYTDDRPGRLTIDQAENIFFTGPNNQLVQKISPDGTLTIVGGSYFSSENADGVGPDAHFVAPSGIAADTAGTIYVSDCDFYPPFPSNSATIRKGQVAGVPTITSQPLSRSVSAGATAQFSVTASAVPAPTLQWYVGSTLFSGATGKTLTLANVRSTDAADYTVVVTNSLGSVTSNKATLTVTTAASPSPGSTPPSTSGSGGGGSISAWFVLTLSALGMAYRRGLRKRLV